MTSRFRPYANAVRRLLIATGGDRLVAGLAERLPGSAIAARGRPDASHYSSPTRRRAKRDGLWFDFDLSDYMQWSAYFSVEKKLRSRLYSLVRPGAVAVDVGSNIGEVLLNFARRVGPQGRAIGFEANPRTFAQCQANIALNGLANVEVHQVGLGDCEGQLTLGRPCAGNSGADRFVEGGDILVRVTTLDRFVEALALRRVDLIKIDVEGFETKVLAGAEQSLRRFRPVLFVELSDANLREQGSSADALVAWLCDHGYTAAEAETGRAIDGRNLEGCFLDIICRPT